MKTFFLMLLVFCSVKVNSSELVKENFEWYQSNLEYIEGKITHVDDETLLPIINILGLIWQYRDGVIGAEVAPTIALALIYQPDEMLSWFKMHPIQFNEWLANLPSVLLTDYDGSYEDDIQQLKFQLIKSLEEYHSHSHSQEMVEKLIYNLKNTEVRVVD